MRRFSESDLELDHACMNLRQGNIDSLLKAASDGWIELPGYVWRTKHEDTIIVIANSLHLNKELSFNSSGCLILSLAATSTEWIDLIDEDDGRLVFPC